jgi:ribose-phosphate pyrophosphokinase
MSDPTLFAGPANLPLADAIAREIGVPLGDCSFRRHPDGELHVEVEESVRGRDVYLIQPTSPPVDEHLLALLLLADACRRAGAARVTAVVPYFGYARQDRRASGREPVTARLVADLIRTSGIERLVAVDLHTTALEGFFSIPVEHISAVPILTDAVRVALPARPVIVSPDLGAVKLAESYAKALRAPVAFIHKTRAGGEEVTAERVIGEVRGRAPVIVDDMISTGATVEAAMRALAAAGALGETVVAATHGLLVGRAVERLGGNGVERFLVTNSVLQRPGVPLPRVVVDLAPLLAEAIRRLHTGASMSDLIVHA